VRLWSDRPFWELDDGEVRAMALSPEVAPDVPVKYLPAVVENLLILQGHARILAAAMGTAAGSARPGKPFAP
jgi:hypothetical protein